MAFRFFFCFFTTQPLTHDKPSRRHTTLTGWGLSFWVASFRLSHSLFHWPCRHVWVYGFRFWNYPFDFVAIADVATASASDDDDDKRILDFPALKWVKRVAAFSLHIPIGVNFCFISWVLDRGELLYQKNKICIRFLQYNVCTITFSTIQHRSDFMALVYKIKRKFWTYIYRLFQKL